MTTTEIDLTYAGRRLTSKNTLAYFYAPADEPDSLRGFQKPLVPGSSIGTVIRVTQSGPDSFVVGGADRPRAIERSTDTDRLLRWSIQQEADVAEHAQLAESKRIAKAGDDPIRAQLEPIRDQIAAMSSARRAATIGWIISYLSTGRPR